MTTDDANQEPTVVVVVGLWRLSPAVILSDAVEDISAEREMKYHKIAIAICVGLYTSSANADWQYTKWGMTVEQAREVSKGKLRPPLPSEMLSQIPPELIGVYGPGLIGVYDMGKLHFNANLYFSGPNKTLDLVALKLLDLHSDSLLSTPFANVTANL